MNHTPWKILSVAEFIDRYRAQSELQTIGDQSLAIESTLIWQKQTVQTFFANYHWSPKPAATQSTEPFGLRLSVQSFLQHFTWDAPVPSFQPAISPSAGHLETDNTISLQNFSDLF